MAFPPNRFYLLPEDLQNLIYTIIDNNAANKIIEYWYRYIDKKVIAINLITRLPTENLYSYNGNIYTVFNSLNSNVRKTFEYCSRVLSGNEDNQWWCSKINMLGIGLMLFNAKKHENLGNYKKNNIAFLSLARKFNKTNIALFQQEPNGRIVAMLTHGRHIKLADYTSSH